MTDKLLLKVLVGSRAQNLHTDESDYDYRGVYITPTVHMLSLNHNYKGSHWLEGKEDQTTYELQHFLQLAIHCNPTILEVFVAPVVIDVYNGRGETTKQLFLTSNNEDAQELRDLFPSVWNPQNAFDAFVGYGLNQRKKLLDDKDKRARKYAIAYLRTLWNLNSLLTRGTFTLDIIDVNFNKELRELKYGTEKLDVGAIINRAEELTAEARTSLANCSHTPDINKVNDFLLRMREKYWKIDSK